jgi:hypothetical protein
MTNTSGIYTPQPTGSLGVSISPQGAIDAGAKWRLVGTGTWRDSGATETGIPVGQDTIEFSDVSGWTKPGNQTVTITQGQTTTSGTYTQQPMGSLRVTILPQPDAIDAGAKWRRVGTSTWQDSGATESGILVGQYTVEFSDVAGWVKPGNKTVTISNGQTANTSGTYVPQTGFLVVTILPQAAIDAGAQWQVDGGGWQSSGYTETDVLTGQHTVTFSEVVGWTKPTNRTVTISNGKTTGITETYTQQPTGSLQVTITPQGAIDAGAKWRRTGTSTWFNSGATESGILVGQYTVEFSDVSGWTKAANQPVTISNGQTATASGTYTPPAGSLQVTITPQGAIDAGAKWRRVATSTWQDSGVTESGILVGQYTVEFSDVAGWTKPGNKTVTINQGQTANTSGTYAPQTGFLVVTILPQAAIDAGAQWQVDGGGWRSSGYTETDLLTGQHTVTFSEVVGWNKPTNRTVTISKGKTTGITETYTQQTGSLTVTISPQGAIDAGAKWRRTGTSTWRDSGVAESGIPVGQYTVEFSDVSGWTKPANQPVTISNGQTATASGTYTPPGGSLQVTITPQGASDAGAKWRRVGTSAWQDSGTTESGVPVGQYTVEFIDVAGWTKPAKRPVTISDGQTTTATGTYIVQTGSLRGTISPQGAIDAGAKWRRTGTSTWRDSGVAETGIPVGQYTVEFIDVAGWTKPADQPVTISDGQTATATGVYILQVGSLLVTITPQGAIDAGAKWRRVGTSTWRGSGTTETGIPVGQYAVEFNTVSAWTKPANQMVAISDGLTSDASGIYTPPSGSLRVTITPQGAIDAGAKWRRVGTSEWCDSGYTESGILVGQYTVEFSDVTGWTKPANRTVTISNGQTTTATGTHILQTGYLRVTISPSGAVNAGAKWRRVGTSGWCDSGYAETGIPVGQHPIEFSDLAGWTKPDNQTVTISNRQTTTASGAYIGQNGSLRVTISPQGAIDAGAKWRRTGTSTWFNSGAMEPGILVGQYTVEFIDVAGWTKPASQMVTISDGQMTNASGIYTLPAGSLRVTISPQGAIDAGAKWRRVGTSTWQDRGATEAGIPVGQYTVEFSDVSGWTKPANQAVTIIKGQTTAATGTYVHQTGSLRVTISPSGAVNAGAKWRRVGTSTWQNNGATEAGIPVGQYTVEFSDVTGWTEPANQPVTIING